MRIVMMTKGKKIGIGLDRTVIGLPYPKLITHEGMNPTAEELNFYEAKKKQFHSQIKHVESMLLFSNYHCSNVKGTNLKRYKVLSDIDGELLCIFTLGFNYVTGVINFELNPSKLNPEQFAEIGGLLTVMFYDHYEELFTRGVVSHAEFYTDVAGEKLSNLVLIDSGRRTLKDYKGTTYHGPRGSRLVTTLYDKAKQQKTGGQLVRFEARLNRRDIRFKDFVGQNLFNPLSTSLVVETSAMQLVSQKWNISHLGNNIKELGLYGATANKYSRKVIWTFLQEQAVSWWQPDVFWAAHRKLLLKLQPGHAGVFA